MEVVIYIAVYSIAYFLGSIPSAVWIGKWFHGSDVREHGSGNAGTINSIRTFGWTTGLVVLLMDVSKGILAVMLPGIFGLAEPDTIQMTHLQILTGSMAILGHLFPIFADFRGGKGVATIFGVLLILQPQATLICAGIFVLIFCLTGIASVSSLLAVTAFPLLIHFAFGSPSKVFTIFSIAIAVLLYLTHHANIARIVKHQEKQLFNIWKKK